MFDELKKRWRLEEEQRKLEQERRRALLLSRAPQLLEPFGVTRAVLFGSLAQARGTARSDVDLFVTPLPAGRYWELKHTLEQAFELPVELYTQDDDPDFVGKVIQRGETIYEA
jgi:predicted nucleotidyltransferase